MMAELLAAHVALALGVGLLSAYARGRPFRPSRGLLDALISLALPVVGPATALAGLALERTFRRRGPPSADVDSGADDPAPIRDLDPLEELRVGMAVAPVAEILAVGDLEEIDRTLRRLVESDRPSVLRLLKDALQSPRLDVRIRARGLLVRVEDRLMKRARGADDPADRSRASRKLAELSTDSVTVRQHLRDAARGFEECLAADPGSSAGSDLGRTLLLLGEAARARDVLTRHLRNHPDDSEARLVRAQASLRLSDVPAARRDCQAVDLPALE